MKTAKSYKILILLAVLFLSLITAFGFMNVKTVSADTVEPAVDFITVSNEGSILSGKLSYAKEGENYNGKIKIDVEQGNTVKFDNKLVVEQSTNGAEFEIAIEKPEGMELNLNVTAKAFDVNGQRKDADADYDTEITTKFDVTSNTIILGLQNNYIVYNDGTNEVVSNEEYNKVEVVDGRVVVSIEFEVESVGENKSFYLVSVDQKKSDADSNYKQTFEIENGKLKKTAYPRAIIDKTAYVKTADGYVLNKIDGVGYNFKLSRYALLNISGTLQLAASEAKSMGSGDNDKSITFTVESTKTFITFNLGNDIDGNPIDSKMNFEVVWPTKVNGESKSVDVEKFTANVYTRESNKAPTYDNSAVAMAQLDSFQQKLQEATIDKDTDTSIALGKTIKVPSLENLVIDDMTSYNDMTKTYHYWTPTDSDKTTTSSTSVTLNKAGEYKLYVTTSEKTAGQKTLEMESDIFYDVVEKQYYEKVDGKFVALASDDQKVLDALNPNDEKHVIYVFTFEIHDNAPLLVEAHEQANGFVGIKYVANKFNITASGYTTTYKLYYNANKNATEDSNGWVEIVAYKKANQEGANDYTYEELKAIGYDGEVTFTPDKIGAYKIVCEVTSQKSYKTASDTALIKIVSEPTIVEPANYWFEDNLASLVFLGIGTLCLIAIIVLLFIKPKNKIEDEE